MRLPFSNARTERVYDAELTDYSQKGVSLKLHDEAVDQFFTGNAVELILENDGLTYAFPAVVRRARGARLGLELTELSPEAERAFIAATFCRADAWVQPKTAAPGFLDGTHALLSFACRGYSALWQYAPPALRRIARPPLKLAQWILSFAPRRRPRAPSLILGVGRGSSNPGMLI
ncbi:PilZ domain-containing protein [Sutterella wadsworthensis]|uniref:PilZ domain-containing protein n=1 Tax=Sutterella wadsworthensis TaxID=40545 RepID=UPI0039676939